MRQRRQREETTNEAPLARQEEQSLASVLLGNAWKSNKFRMSVLLWLLGLFFMFLAPAPIQLTAEQESKFQSQMTQAMHIKGMAEAQQNVYQAAHAVEEEKVWFWRFREPYKSNVAQRQAILNEYQSILSDYERQQQAEIRKAKHEIGIWSSYGLKELRERFWSIFDSAKVFAQRHTFWQMVYRVLAGSRDDNILSLVIEWIFTSLVNFTFSLIGSFFYFFATLFEFLASYQVDFINGVLFGTLALLGAASVIVSYLLGLYGMAISGMYVMTKAAVREIEFQEQRRRYVRQN